jgi:hypothetical protein
MANAIDGRFIQFHLVSLIDLLPIDQRFKRQLGQVVLATARWRNTSDDPQKD